MCWRYLNAEPAVFSANIDRHKDADRGAAQTKNDWSPT
jgi:hypothetical protein